MFSKRHLRNRGLTLLVLGVLLLLPFNDSQTRIQAGSMLGHHIYSLELDFTKMTPWIVKTGFSENCSSGNFYTLGPVRLSELIYYCGR